MFLFLQLTQSNKNLYKVHSSKLPLLQAVAAIKAITKEAKRDNTKDFTLIDHWLHKINELQKHEATLKLIATKIPKMIWHCNEHFFELSTHVTRDNSVLVIRYIELMLI